MKKRVCCYLHGARAAVGGEALAAVADPGLAVVADGADHGQAGGVLAGVADDAVARLHHALDLAALGADGKPSGDIVNLTARVKIAGHRLK